MSFEEKLFKLGQDIAEMSTKMEKDGTTVLSRMSKASQYKQSEGIGNEPPPLYRQ